MAADKEHKKRKKATTSQARDDAAPAPPTAEPKPRMKRKEYEREMRHLHGELVALQEWVKATGAKICIVFEGRDTAGKGGTIKRITERVSPRVFRVVALPAPTEREKSQMYIQRYVPHFPAAGEVVIFDRSWYNRAGVERVMGFCTEERDETLPRTRPRRGTGHGRLGDRPASSTGSRSAARSRPAGSRAASTTPARSGSCRTSTWCPTAGGTTTRGPATTCSPPPTPDGRPGTSPTPTTRSAPASTSSPTCSVRCPTNPSAGRRSPCPTATSPGTTPSPTHRAATSPRRSDPGSSSTMTEVRIARPPARPAPRRSMPRPCTTCWPRPSSWRSAGRA